MRMLKTCAHMRVLAWARMVAGAGTRTVAGWRLRCRLAAAKEARRRLLRTCGAPECRSDSESDEAVAGPSTLPEGWRESRPGVGEPLLNDEPLEKDDP